MPCRLARVIPEAFAVSSAMRRASAMACLSRSSEAGTGATRFAMADQLVAPAAVASLSTCSPNLPSSSTFTGATVKRRATHLSVCAFGCQPWAFAAGGGWTVESTIFADSVWVAASVAVLSACLRASSVVAPGRYSVSSKLSGPPTCVAVAAVMIVGAEAPARAWPKSPLSTRATAVMGERPSCAEATPHSIAHSSRGSIG